MKKAFIIAPWLILAFILFSADSCGGQQTLSESGQVNDQQTIYATNQPLHKYDYSPELDASQQIYDARMKDVNTWTIIFPPVNSGIKPYVCPSIGYPLPYTTQQTNPSQIVPNPGGSTGSAVIAQAEPNGLYTGSTNATWVRCVRTLPGGGSETVPVYSEPDALAYPYPVKIEDGTIVDAGGSSSVSIKTKV